MREAQDFRAGNSLKIEKDLFIILKATYNKGARGASSMKLKLKNLESGAMNEIVFRADDKLEDIVLDHIKMQYLYSNGDSYTFMDTENYEQIDLQAELLGDALNYLKEQMIIDVVMYGDKPTGVEMPNTVEMTIAYTEPAVRGNTGGKVLKTAKLDTGFEIQVPMYCIIGENIKVDTRTGEFISRAKE